MREGWEYKKFENCIVKSPKLKQVKKEAYNNGSQYPIISQEEKFISGYCDDESIVCHIDRPIVVFGDHTRVLKYIDFDFVVGADGVKVIIPIKSIDSKFLLYFLQWYNIPNLGYSRHYKLLKDITVPIPHCTTQKTIVSELDKLNELIQIKKEQLKDYDALAQSIFYEMFGDPVENEKGWEVKKFGEIGTLERGAGISKKDFVDDGLPCIHYGQLHTTFGAYTRKNITFIPKDLLPKYKIAHSGDLILAITSEDVEGSCKSTAWLGDYDVVVGSDAAIFHHNQNGIYLSYYTRTKAFYNEKAKYAKGFKVTHISTKEIASISICVPPLSIQNTFANKIEQIERQKTIIQESIADLETLLASRMQYWFD